MISFKMKMIRFVFCTLSLIVVSGLWWSLATSDNNRGDLAADEREERVESAESESSSPVSRELFWRIAEQSKEAYPVPAHLEGIDLSKQTAEQAASKSHGCIQCHETVHDPHASPETVRLGCVDCHGGDPAALDKATAHVHPRFPGVWSTSANPVRSYAVLNHEKPEFIRFVNPGDLRIAHLSCGTANCHGEETLQVHKSMMTNGCMLWGAALYNNGAVPNKWSRYGESYSMNGSPQRLQTVPAPTKYEMEKKGVLPFLDPLPRFQVTQPGNVLRIFERGGRFILEPGIPERLEEPGRPRNRLSNRGLGTLNRTDPVFIGLQKTRLLDPTLNFMGTNDHAGDYRSSGCTSCHFVYANDRSPIHSGPYAKYGNRGTAASQTDQIITSVDPTIPKDESGHPIQHKFTTAVPTSQCIVCHVHPGTNVLNSYLGYTWWDQETDGELMYPPEQKELTNEDIVRGQMSNPNDGALRGNWSDPEFLANITRLNSQLRHTQFADFHGHGWVFRAVYKKNRAGILVDHAGNEILEPTNAQLQQGIVMPQYVKQMYVNRSWTEKDAAHLAEMERELNDMKKHVPVHMMDIHLEKGMHCVDCHFVQDVHGDTKLYGEVRAAIEIKCIDCHGDIDGRAFKSSDGIPRMRTSGPAAKERGRPEINGRSLLAMRTPFGKRRFEVRGNRVIQNSMVEPNVSWDLTQVADTIDPASPKYNPRSALAKTVRFTSNGSYKWGDVPKNKADCAHANNNMSCIACHSAWNPSCFGCHLPQKANKKMPNLHNEGDVTRNHVSYNFQTLRDEVYMLSRDGNVTNNRIGPARSSCAIHVGSYNASRESIYVQQQTISSEGLSGIAFSSNVPHTVRGKQETKNCTDCHVSKDNDNNALMAQLLMHGTGYLNFMGRYCWVASGEHGLHAVVVTERDEPQAVIGSSLHEMAFPKHHRKHVEKRRQLAHAHEHPGIDISDNVFRPFKKNEVVDLQQRGEYVYAACGEGGLRIFDIAFIDHKGFSERITTAPVSPLGQKFYVRTKCATAVAAPATTAPDPTRTHRAENHEPAIHPLYGYIYVADSREGLILVGAATLLDGNPTNNFVKRDVTFNPDGVLDGAKAVSIVGTYAYVCSDAGLVVISLDDPKNPEIVNIVGADILTEPHAVQLQFRYCFVCDEEGVKVLDVTDLAKPKFVSKLEIPEAHNIYLARTYAYVAGGSQGLIIVDIKNPELPRVDQVFDAYGAINDLHDVQLGIAYNSQFAYLADGANGMRIVQLTSPEVRGNNGFSPRPAPRLIATYKIPKKGHALAITRGVDRDRAVDEAGNQISVFGRVGARPLNLEEQRKMFLHDNRQLWRVIDGKRDFSQPDARRREIDLHRQLEEYYGPSAHERLRN